MIEMTWGETGNTQREGKREPLKQSRCFALTSIELLGCAVIIEHLLIIF